jgi:hypothetical protein
MTQSFNVELLHGLLETGRRHTLAELRDPTGHDEARFAELGQDAAPAERASALIAALTLRIGGCERPSMDQILQLTAGDRERILFATSARLLGPRLDLVTSCPACRNLIEIPVRFEDVIALRPAPMPDRIALEARDGRWIARCRPPTGADLERAVRGGPNAPRMLIVDCLIELIDPVGNRVAPAALPVECENHVAKALAELDPAAECRMDIECPSCANPINAFLSGYIILQTALGDMRRVYDDVFRMARAYHWSEAEILSLPLRRRRHYLAVAGGAGANP